MNDLNKLKKIKKSLNGYLTKDENNAKNKITQNNDLEHLDGNTEIGNLAFEKPKDDKIKNKESSLSPVSDVKFSPSQENVESSNRRKIQV